MTKLCHLEPQAPLVDAVSVSARSAWHDSFKFLHGEATRNSFQNCSPNFSIADQCAALPSEEKSLLHSSEPSATSNSTREPAQSIQALAFSPEQRLRFGPIRQKLIERGYSDVAWYVEHAAIRDGEEKDLLPFKLPEGQQPHEKKISEHRDELLTWAELASQQVLGKLDWPLIRLDANSKASDFAKTKEVQMIVHPLYGIFEGDHWDAGLWQRSGGNVDKYIDAQLIKFGQLAAEALKEDPASHPKAYYFLQDLVREIEAISEPETPNVLRVYVMPRHILLSAEKREAMHTLLQRYGTKDSRVVDSIGAGDGMLSSTALDGFKKVPRSADVKFQGGYIQFVEPDGACVQRCYLGILAEHLRTPQQLSVDVNALSVMSNTPAKESASVSDSFPPIASPDQDLTSRKAIVSWIRQNGRVSKAYNADLASSLKVVMPEGMSAK